MSNLRARRRAETARMIQKATIELVNEQGFDAVTSEAISRHAGVSPRTFFNYFPNKEAAIFGEVPSLPDADIQAFLSGSGPERGDLYRLMRAHTLKAGERRDELKLIVSLVQTQPRMMEIYMAQREIIGGALAELLSQRFRDSTPIFLAILAHSLLSMSWTAIQHWLETDRPLDLAFEEAWQALTVVSQLILKED
ncbi:TetR/AcrR family transcriptional regulator [Pseudooceanicola sp. CBS1P-1]|uniref:TetR family transcriptional regulator n=1 Tax=Pseudooceanicola albus TaxID=2692189 RepID=A0A6L7G782_9RHOB|nr:MULTISPECIES: TetR family transcriptional regulator [Pseudooceanicola]MBT9384331.1 TetR/AcrR family transcriptional regulator [Pseudooceanicola endophyticus]MXN19931.1 TetR family transcriptional regulator [Pseudooceanicola albus]